MIVGEVCLQGTFDFPYERERHPAQMETTQRDQMVLVPYLASDSNTIQHGQLKHHDCMFACVAVIQTLNITLSCQGTVFRTTWCLDVWPYSRLFASTRNWPDPPEIMAMRLLCHDDPTRARARGHGLQESGEQISNSCEDY